jgi:cell division septal protein FtsQ
MVVRQVKVSGLSQLTPEEAAVTQASAVIPPHSNIIRARFEKTVRALSSLPWVASVTPHKHYPAGVEFAIIPRQAVALVTGAGGRWEVDGAGIAIRTARAGTRLPEITVPDTSGVHPGARIDVPGVSVALSAVSLAHGSKPVPIVKIEVDQNADICLNMKDNVAIRLGAAEDIGAKLALVHRIYNDKPDIGTLVQSIDLRSPESPSCVPRAAAKDSSPDAVAQSQPLREEIAKSTDHSSGHKTKGAEMR